MGAARNKVEHVVCVCVCDIYFWSQDRKLTSMVMRYVLQNLLLRANWLEKRSEVGVKAVKKNRVDNVPIGQSQ